MIKITKKALMEKALKKYTPWRIEEAIFCKVEVHLKVWNSFWDNPVSTFQLTNRWKKTKVDKIRTEIRSLILNVERNESNKRLIGNTSSENIESIKISLKFK